MILGGGALSAPIKRLVGSYPGTASAVLQMTSLQYRLALAADGSLHRTTDVIPNRAEGAVRACSEPTEGSLLVFSKKRHGFRRGPF
jgi:hypothetical protein